MCLMGWGGGGWGGWVVVGGGGGGRGLEGFGFILLISSYDVLHEIVTAHSLNLSLDAG